MNNKEKKLQKGKFKKMTFESTDLKLSGSDVQSLAV